jgi:quercetin dioxygenase-like cupin family protein
MTPSAQFPPEITALPAFDGPFDAHRLEAEHCDVLFASYPAGTKIAAHRHDTNNVGVITQGALVLTINGTTQTFVTGQWYHVPADTEHEARFDVDSAEIEFWFHQ